MEEERKGGLKEESKAASDYGDGQIVLQIY